VHRAHARRDPVGVAARAEADRAQHLRRAREPVVRLVERGRVREQPGDRERVRCLHQQRAGTGERQRALAVDAAQHRRVREVARGHQTRRPSVRVVIAAASRS
jgi:hypothetical protein